MTHTFSRRARMGQLSLTLGLVVGLVALLGPFQTASAQEQAAKPRIAVFSGATSTIANSPPLVTSNKAREKYSLPLLTNPDGSPVRDVLRPQRLAAAVTVYIEQFSAHPLEGDVAELYAPPDGYLDAQGVFHRERQGPNDTPVYEVVLRPEDGLYLLPYMARQANGQAWEDDCVRLFAPPEQCRQGFYPDASRLFEEIDRLGIGAFGRGGLLSSKADFDFYRPAPPGGYTKGLPADQRTDVGQGDIPPETLGVDYFPYRPFWLGQTPPRPTLARVTNMVQGSMASGQYAGAIWLEGSPNVEDTLYWLNLLIDTTVPIVGNASHRLHGQVGNDGDHNIIDAVEYIVSGIWADEAGRDRIGAVAAQDERIFTAREVQKADARPGGYIATGGHGGIVATLGEASPFSPPVLTFVPNRRHTHTSALNMTQLPQSAMGVQARGSRIVPVPVQIKDERGDLLGTAIPKVTMVKDGRYFEESAEDDPAREVDILARLEQNLRGEPLAGFVSEGLAPYGSNTQSIDIALRQAVYSGLPVVKVGRGNNEGFTPAIFPFISGNNLTATKARLLLMAALMKFGSLPVAADPANPMPEEQAATRAKLAEYQAVFDTH